MHSSRVAATAFAVVLALASAASAQAAIFFPPDATVATSQDDLIALDTNSECTDADGGFTPIAVSHDRGKTGAHGACLESPRGVMLDPGSGAVYALEPKDSYSYELNQSIKTLYLHQLDANGMIASSRAIPTAAPFDVGASAVNDGALYFTETGDAPALRRAEPDGSVSSCALPPGDFAELHAYPGGILVAAEMADPSNPVLSVSDDRCASWTRAPKPPGKRFECTGIKLFSPVRAYVGCWKDGAPGPTAYKLDFASPGKWERTKLAGVGYDYYDQRPDIFVPADESKIHVEGDTYGIPSWPAGWQTGGPRTGVVGGKAPAGKAAQALSYLNERFRRPFGLPDLGWSTPAGKAAQNHASYYARNGYSGHGEKRGKPGFTGNDPSARCAKAGWKGGCGEVASPQGEILDSAKSWMSTPLHGRPFLSNDSVGLGWSKNGAVGKFVTPPREAYTIDLGAKPNTPGSAIKMWPADGMKGIATRWWGNESPNPLRFYTGDRDDVGPTLFAATEQAMTVTVSKRGSTARLPLLSLYGKRARPSYTFTSGYGGIVTFFIARELKPATDYVISARVAGKTHRFTFTTAKPAANVS